MKKNNKNKKCIYAALASAMLLCSACGAQNAAQTNDDTAQESIQDNNLAATMTDAPDQDDATAENNTTGSTEDSADRNNNSNANNDNGNDGDHINEEPTDNDENPARISITYETIENNDTAEDGTSIYTSSINYPIVSIEGNAAAAEKINADILERVNTFQADTTTLDTAREIYQLEAADSEYPFLGYSSDMTFATVRSDSNVISFVMSFYNFSGGAHGNYYNLGINYNTKSGELIPFDALGKAPGAFYADTLAYNKELAATESYQERMFENAIEDLETVLYEDEKWYLSPDGLVFISNPYELGPYVAGMIEFTIPYQDLENMGLNQEYWYTE